MTDTGYLVLNRRGIVKLAKRVPSLRSGEILVKLNVTFDNQLFEPPIIDLNINQHHILANELVEQRVPRIGVQYVPGLDDQPEDEINRREYR